VLELTDFDLVLSLLFSLCRTFKTLSPRFLDVESLSSLQSTVSA